MYKRILKRTATFVMCGLLCIGSVAPVTAATSNYTFTVTKNGSVNDDNKSLKTYKDGGSAYEASFYVTPTGFSCTSNLGKIYVWSVQDEFKDVMISNTTVLHSGHVGQTKKVGYKYKVGANMYYRLMAAYYSGTISAVSGTGRYTP